MNTMKTLTKKIEGKLEKLTNSLTDEEIFDMVYQYVTDTALILVSRMEAHNIRGNIFFKNIINEVRNNPDMQNNLFRLDEETSSLRHYTSFWIDLEVCRIYINYINKQFFLHDKDLIDKAYKAGYKLVKI